MTVYAFAPEPAAEHQRALRASADAYRLARTARQARRRSRAGMLSVRIRSIRSDDTALLTDLIARLSPQTRLARFLYPKQELTAKELRYLTQVDHHHHEALLAITRFRGTVVGLAQFVRSRDDPLSAEVAVVVADEWQERGLGSLLATRLAARARCENVDSFTALTSAGNVRARRLLARLGDIEVSGRDGSTTEYRVALPATARDRAGAWRRPARLAPAGCAGGA